MRPILPVFSSRLMLLCLLAGSIVQAAGYQTPLTEAEIALAHAVAHESVPAQRGSAATNSSPASALGVQTLLIDIKTNKLNSGAAGSARRAEIFLYDYAAQATHYRLVDLHTRQIVSSQTLGTHHLPLNAAERQFALRQAAADLAVLQQIEAEYEQFVDSTFSGLASLRSKVSVYEPVGPESGFGSQHGSQQGAQTDLQKSAQCAATRCALITFTSAERFSFSVEPIVVLNTGEVFNQQIHRP